MSEIPLHMLHIFRKVEKCVAEDELADKILEIFERKLELVVDIKTGTITVRKRAEEPKRPETRTQSGPSS